MNLEEVDAVAYMNHRLWEKLWLDGETDWYPDSLGYLHHTAMARERLDALRATGEQYTTHVSHGVHAFRIGFMHEYRSMT